MRITGGRFKGRLLMPFKGLNIRPSSDKVRESIFNLIGQDTEGMKVLDLFAGTGVLGIEALSRGALWALFIDRSIRCIKLINKNLALCGLESRGYVYKKDLTKGLPTGYNMIKRNFDLVFIDPPYGKGLIPPILMQLTGKNLLESASIVVTESFRNDLLPLGLGGIRLIITRTYGDTKINIYQTEKGDE